ncbi:16S rRNA (uracil(1498)-N(3))-methyltransferase [Mycoplasma sp. 744]|uniref:16S rRNA (uracil(1498)-N(3))-methyltransferase n=1 Tax=unclassified Mycoplasma TaxID=2683645 RepID=UPI00211C0821|nr:MULTISPECIES: 16S rRNA (uracil(1498)-N(3))-methyltransferase [unclassified Mycoplasma]MEA4115491.1 16S rRNA (uracil(1498)-N(3))-methyltransferase [Mycoplasma sp. 744]UUM18990.1 16S rRNA (uracil(1498)-N(3))-methyltransferase [Mycoplasma sp. 1018B]
MHRFFVNQKADDNHFILDEKNLKHLKVARLVNEDFLCVYQKEFYLCCLKNNLASIKNKLDINNEFKNEIILAAPIIKMERFEWLLQKATELGVKKIIPMITKYTNGNLVKYDLFKKRLRHLEILKNAAEQSFRNVIPELLEPTKIENILKRFQNKKIFIAHEKTNRETIQTLSDNCLILVGPEGGFAQEEIELAQQYNAQIVSLGKRILRAETACIYLLSNIKENNE